jgi:hypothetical protein
MIILSAITFVIRIGHRAVYGVTSDESEPIGRRATGTVFRPAAGASSRLSDEPKRDDVINAECEVKE